MDEQKQVAEFIEEHDLEAPMIYRLIDLVSEVGEIAKDVTGSTDYGLQPSEVEISPDELGDALFSLLALAEAAEIDADQALDEALAKYEDRILHSGTASSGE